MKDDIVNLQKLDFNRSKWHVAGCSTSLGVEIKSSLKGLDVTRKLGLGLAFPSFAFTALNFLECPLRDSTSNRIGHPRE
jgi:hypothetical protein